MNIQKPTLVHVIAWTTLASGIVNLFWGFAASGTALATVIGFFCLPITILPTILGVFELIYAAKLFGDPPQAVQPSTNIAILEIANILSFNVFSMAVGILSLVFYNDTVVKDYFARLNGTLAPVTATPSAAPSEPMAAPVFEEPVAPLTEEPAPPSTDELPADESPAKPRRTPRKSTKE